MTKLELLQRLIKMTNEEMYHADSDLPGVMHMAGLCRDGHKPGGCVFFLVVVDNEDFIYEEVNVNADNEDYDWASDTKLLAKLYNKVRETAKELLEAYTSTHSKVFYVEDQPNTNHKHAHPDIFWDGPFRTREETIRHADDSWRHLTDGEQQQRVLLVWQLDVAKLPEPDEDDYVDYHQAIEDFGVLVATYKHGKHHDIYEELSDRITAARMNAKLTQQDVADLFTTTTRTIQRWEAADSVPSDNDIRRLASVLGVSRAYLNGEVAGFSETKDPGEFASRISVMAQAYLAGIGSALAVQERAEQIGYFLDVDDIKTALKPYKDELKLVAKHDVYNINRIWHAAPPTLWPYAVWINRG